MHDLAVYWQGVTPHPCLRAVLCLPAPPDHLSLCTPPLLGRHQVSDLQTRVAKAEAAGRAAEAAAATERAAASRALAAAQQKLTAAGKRVTGLGDLLKQAQSELTEVRLGHRSCWGGLGLTGPYVCGVVVVVWMYAAGTRPHSTLSSDS
jgi:hypothetical protein